MRREVTVIEQGAFTVGNVKRFLLASETEREEYKKLFPALVVRPATEDEMDQLQGKSWDRLDQEELEYFRAMR